MEKQIFKYTIKEPSFTLRKNRIKKIEGRLCKNTFCNIKSNDVILFRNNNRYIETHVVKVTYYKNFYEMLLNEGIKNVTPLSDNIDDSLSIYRKIYRQDNENKYGVIAIHLKN